MLNRKNSVNDECMREILKTFEKNKYNPLFIVFDCHDPDWFFYLCKELSHVFTTYLKDLRILKSLIQESPSPQIRNTLPPSLITQTDHLVTQISSLMREKEIWEESRHGLEIVNLCCKYFQNNEDTYGSFIENLEEIMRTVQEDYACYVTVDAVCSRPVALLQYYVAICNECGCCGGSDGVKKVNFSPVLEKKRDGGTTTPGTLDPHVLMKLHNTHLLVNRILDSYNKRSMRLITISKVQELLREMDGFSTITRSGGDGEEFTGEFVRQGILLKLNKRKGLQNRIFFLFRDMLVYGTRVSSTQGFRLHGIILTRNMELLDSNMSSISSIPYSFCLVVRSNEVDEDGKRNLLVGSSEGIDGGRVNEKILILAAFSVQDHGNWVDSLSRSIASSLQSGSPHQSITSKLFNSSEELLNNNLKSSEMIASSSSQICGGSAQHNRSNALSHVCWHRNISIHAAEIIEKEKHQISGPLLRKFKNSPGWQRLWVVFTNVCLYFYKSANEVAPLASLPLLGYKIELLNESEREQILKEHVFKLVFKNHVYYFRAESRYTFNRWVKVLKFAMVGEKNVVAGG